MEIASRVQAVSPSATLQITARAKSMRKSGIDVVNFGAGEPDFDTPQPIKEAAIKAINEGFTKYTPSSGILELKERIARKFKEENKIEYLPEQIIISCGAKHSIYNLIQVLIDKGDQVIIPSPYWLSYPEMVKLAQGKPVILETRQKDGFKIDIEKLKKKINAHTKLLILNSPSNPAGIVYTKEELQKIAQVCVENKLFVISDEIYEKIMFDNIEFSSLASLGKEIYDLTLTVNGMSKSFSMTGWRIGYFAGPKEIVSAVSNFQDHSTSCPSSISQKAALAAFDMDAAYYSSISAKFQERRDFIVSYLNEKLSEFVSFVKPQGAFYIFINVSKTKLSSLDFAKRFLEESYVAVIPGEPFGCDSWIRISFATSLEEIKKGLQRLELFLIKLKTERLTNS
ncbi:MAG: pyridoxal phosphate-dependent aminotransferase [Candidatus Omnitrophica bacterium]|nr:pyridoxal phosphate-dependent aminotransferase [Candidatus Omnitrophota bacterium]MDD5352230.1 pyridoxal phosphate-dependent aminotransferase [Candidatus Omnitrophota bacterium]MDD5549828.1 pyridoxal phosphate-dependent aminotransferase [Candidatus Omnitrophota bacterium]